MNDALIETAIDDGIAHLRFNRARQLNAFNNDLMRDTLAAMAAFERDASVLTQSVGSCP